MRNRTDTQALHIFIGCPFFDPFLIVSRLMPWALNPHKRVCKMESIQPILLSLALWVGTTFEAMEAEERGACVSKNHLRVCRDLPYGSGESAHALDVYLPEPQPEPEPQPQPEPQLQPQPQPQPLYPVLVLHGGCYSGGDKKDVAE